MRLDGFDCRRLDQRHLNSVFSQLDATVGRMLRYMLAAISQEASLSTAAKSGAAKARARKRRACKMRDVGCRNRSKSKCKSKIKSRKENMDGGMDESTDSLPRA